MSEAFGLNPSMDLRLAVVGMNANPNLVNGLRRSNGNRGSDLQGALVTFSGHGRDEKTWISKQ